MPRGGYRNGGRPPGSKNKSTLEKQKVQEAIQQQIMKIAKRLISSQQIAAQGTHKMIALTKDSSGKLVTETIRDMKRMEELLETGEYGKDYLIVAGADPDWKAADALLNRALGKPVESLELGGKNGEPIKVSIDQPLNKVYGDSKPN